MQTAFTDKTQELHCRKFTLHCELADNHTDVLGVGEKKRKEAYVAVQSLNTTVRLVQMLPVMLFAVHTRALCMVDSACNQTDIKSFYKISGYWFC